MSEAQELVERFLNRHRESISEQNLALVREAYCTAFAHGRYRSDEEVLQHFVRLRQRDLFERRARELFIAVCCAALGYAMGG